MTISENMQKLLEAVKENDELQAKLIYADKDEIVAIAQSAGYDITVADVEAMEAEMVARMKAAEMAKRKGELDDDELDNVAGGFSVHKSFFSKHGNYARLTPDEERRLRAAGYTLHTNGWYSKGDFYDIITPGGESIFGGCHSTWTNLKFILENGDTTYGRGLDFWPRA